MNIIQIPAFTDNYFWLMFEDNNKSAVVVDPGDSAPVIKSLKDNNLELTDILITHHHNDHIGGVSELKKVFPKVSIFGPADPRIPADNIVKDEDVIKLDSLNEEFRVLDVRGHTNSHIAYYFDKKLFCGDTLFSCGCGRLFEGTHEDMHKALTKIKNLPKETLIYCLPATGKLGDEDPQGDRSLPFVIPSMDSPKQFEPTLHQWTRPSKSSPRNPTLSSCAWVMHVQTLLPQRFVSHSKLRL